ncbi:release factor glutamine methyltransferase [Dokdonia sp. Hel_I_63]|uniref:peptide chain release factor N(5)-glutamine methyltransferase n=1 Tax=unclassified Dokdonia TaxID=2615033 RepID=UPI00020A663F|nr:MULTISPECIES: peptide chain release factor N(5)-glutamine methyltransferase [unclassified Dokdonia]AEE18420.1 protein-(glutamine-N5) methyltransferase, release factor-specific [Dokdonia sp. 4H-3-7-5]TVZ22349.1 release factor glutamine methyltransferase [Dokdonia sp. Hel_I_63]
MNIDEFRIDFRQQLAGMYEREEVENLCFLTLEHVLKMNRVEVSLSRKMDISTSALTQLNDVTGRLSRSEPIQYIVGTTEFYGIEFQVNPATLIPRPETEELVDWIITDKAESFVKSETQEKLKILDIGTGSGCIAISLAKYMSKAHVEAIDISQDALATAYQNAKRNEVDVTFYNQDVLAVEELEHKYDIIVSNPPYVRMLEKKEMRDNVLSNEPDSALFVSDDDPLIFYRKIGELAFESLSVNGFLYFEINEYLGKEMIDLLKVIGFENVELREDMFGKDRMIKASR